MIKLEVCIDTIKPPGEEIYISTIIQDSTFLENCMMLKEVIGFIKELQDCEYDNTILTIDEREKERDNGK